MITMSRRALILMAIVLAAATTAAAATALAGEQNELRKIGQSVSSGVHTSFDATRKARVLSIKPIRSTNGLVVVRPPKR